MEFYFIAIFQFFALIGLFISFMACVSTVHFICDPEAFDEEE